METHTHTQMSQSNHEKEKNGAGRVWLPDFRLYHKATIVKTVWYWHKNRNTEQERKPAGHIKAMFTLHHSLLSIMSKKNVGASLVAHW